MSTTASRRCLQTCLRSLQRTELGSRRIANRRFPGVRGYAQAALKQKEDVVSETPAPPSAATTRATWGATPTFWEAPATGASRWKDDWDPQALQDHLNNLFAPLKFPQEVAQRVLTHGSHGAARVHGHNAGYQFMGRRVIESYLFMFLNASKALKPKHDLEALASHALNPGLLGETVGTKWGYGQVVQWLPAVSRKELENAQDIEKAWKRIGFYKIQGDAVVATLGAVYQQYGASIAHKLFHTRILPELFVPGGLPPEFQKEALALASQLGGTTRPLTKSFYQSQSPSEQ
ncbi:hypothetical protein CC1G_09589 [Coprinopsis cinerea okayama7|uniref:RNase III domain-containing protein n=1 Tax=Coprinopsis cinerea (strain Okayama-7 / 130 / ATCC MYA-4618 / FGSC 9003) TaxID=240176 RepID=A8P9A2_COPC7|nr:hypothetical protein CC1G_09589 [Coprinopsis cinerea okayama7\|eukprot:XP_001839734.1 hypothetical protein CC1G_09589 [Coprinopsis cinerea okayama7\